MKVFILSGILLKVIFCAVSFRFSALEAGIVKSAQPSRTYIAQRTEEKIVIDGKLNEPAWEQASVIAGFYTWGEENKLIPAKFQTEVRVLWDDKYLYVGAVMDDRDIYAQEGDHVTVTTTGDVFEVFIKPFEYKPNYFEFHVNPRNTTLQVSYPGRRMGHVSEFVFEGGMKSAVSLSGVLNEWRHEDKGWTVEAAIPFSALREVVAPPEKGSKWKVAFCRYCFYYRADKNARVRELSSSARLSRPSFHEYENYDAILFSE